MDRLTPDERKYVEMMRVPSDYGNRAPAIDKLIAIIDRLLSTVSGARDAAQVTDEMVEMFYEAYKRNDWPVFSSVSPRIRDGLEAALKSAAPQVGTGKGEGRPVERFQDEGDAAKVAWAWLRSLASEPMPPPAYAEFREMRGQMGTGKASDDAVLSLWVNDRLRASCVFYRDGMNFTVLACQDHLAAASPQASPAPTQMMAELPREKIEAALSRVEDRFK